MLAGSLGLMIVPTTLLGATFPAMASVLRAMDNPVGSTGLFYGVNTLGAVVGCLGVSFVALPALGPGATTWALAVMNAGIALAVWWASGRLDAAAAGVASARSEAAGGEASEVAGELGGQGAGEGKAAFPLAGALALAGASGFVSIAVEVLWIRGLALSFTASVYVFSLVLAAFLVGIGLGSLALGGIFKRRAATSTHLVMLYLGAGLGVWLTLSLFPELMPVSLSLMSSGAVSSWSGFLGSMGLMSVLVMLPSTLAMGASLPLLIGMATRGRGEASRAAGRIYGINTVAGVLGSLAGTFWLMPWLGVSKALALMAACFGVIALTCALIGGVDRRLAVACGVWVLSIGGLSVGGLSPEINPLKERFGQELRFYEDDPSGTITIHEDARGVLELRLNNQHGLSNTAPATVEMQYTLGHLPMALHPAPRRALLIGFATGTTLSAMAEHGVERLDCVELVERVLDLAPWFESVNQRVAANPAAHLVAADGRRFVASPGAQYDVIVGDLYMPRDPGVGALYSLEHFRSIRARLSRDGVFVAWLPLFQMGPQEVASVVRTFLEVFPEAEGWVGNWVASSPVLGLVGWAGAPFAPEGVDAQLQARVMASLERAPGVGALPAGGSFVVSRGKDERFPTRRLLGPAHLRAWAGQAPINNLERPLIEFSAPRSLMEAALSRRPLAGANLERIAQIGTLSPQAWQRPSSEVP